MKKTSDKTILYNLPSYKTGDGRPNLLRIIVTTKFAKIDFGYQTMRKYEEGGWVRMARETFIRIKPSGEKLTMTEAVNIPYAPQRHDFKTRKDWLYFSLYFPPFPPNTKLFDLIEADPGVHTDTHNDFNFFDIKLNHSEAIEIL